MQALETPLPPVLTTASADCVIGFRSSSWFTTLDVFSASLRSKASRPGDVERCGGNPRDLRSFYVVANYRTPHIKAFMKSRAAFFVARELRAVEGTRAAGLLPTVALDWISATPSLKPHRIFCLSETVSCPLRMSKSVSSNELRCR
jgi:hypothetical protein